jgi:hypothetical protein
MTAENRQGGLKITIGGSREVMEEMIWQEWSMAEKPRVMIVDEYRVSPSTVDRIIRKKKREYGEAPDG